MMKCLLINFAAAMRSNVLQLFARLILVFAFLAGTIHAPAIAHPEPDSHQSAHGAFSAHDVLTDHHEAPSSTPDDAGEGLHHHHCPAAVDSRTVDVAIGMVAAKAVLPFYRSAALSSFSQAPPTEPPSA